MPADMELTRYYDPPDPNAWRESLTWNGAPVMPESCRPLSFLVNRPLARRPPPVVPEKAPVQIEPRSLPPAKYVPPPPPPPPDPLIASGDVILIDGQRHTWVDGQLFPLEYEKHPGPQPQQFRPRPVPGVSKKGRGRHVPTKEAGGRKGTTYTCSVEDCHKVFKRHEHLKRHVMSLHSNEQNYMCALPFCDKTFNRRDNLLQHERKHTLYQRLFDCTKNFDGELIRNEWEDIKNPDAIYEWPEPWDSGVGIPLSLRYLNLTARDLGDMDEDNVADDDSTMADVGDHPDYTVHFVRYEEPLQPGSPVLVRSDPFAPSDNMFTVFNVSAIHPDDPSASWDDQTIANHELDVPLFDLPSPSNDIKVIPADTVTV